MVTNMKILVFSDSHGRLSLMLDAVAQEKPQRVFFLGDNYRDGQSLSDAYPDIPMELVVGNCDFCAGPTELVVEPRAGRTAWSTLAGRRAPTWCASDTLTRR